MSSGSVPIYMVSVCRGDRPVAPTRARNGAGPNKPPKAERYRVIALWSAAGGLMDYIRVSMGLSLFIRASTSSRLSATSKAGIVFS